MKKVLIAGFGEIGQSLGKIYVDKEFDTWVIDPSIRRAERERYPIILNEAYYEDKGSFAYQRDKELEKVDVLNICFPHSKDFVSHVVDYIKQFDPQVTIIHSTVPIRTTRRIAIESQRPVAHSPVMGLHPKLTESMLTFEKIVGPVDALSYDLVEKHFSELGLKARFYFTPEESEMAKIFSTTRYGHEIMFQKMVKDYCDENAIDFNQVYSETTEIYNNGYTDMGLERFRRPMLHHMDGPIGGHCIIPNAELISYDFIPAEEIVAYNERLVERKKNKWYSTTGSEQI